MSQDVTERVTEPRPEPRPGPQAMTPRELLRWSWRQLTSMRTALLLLLLLALASVPGSVVPQENLDPVRVSQWRADHPDLAVWYDRLGLFEVYSSVWFTAIYILLMASLMGCIVPRLRVYAKHWRARPPRTPRNLGRLPSYASRTVELPAEEALARAERELGRFRLARYDADGVLSVSAERGQLREAGNLLFHLSILIVLVGFAYGQLFGYKGGAIVLVGGGFTNELTQYDDFSPGSLTDVDDLAPLTFTVDDFDVEFRASGPEIGSQSAFTAKLTYTDGSGGPKPFDLRVNHPLTTDGVDVFLIGNGYAPIIKVTDGNGDVARNGPVVFLPEDATFTSVGVLKAPDARPTQLGFEGWFYPTYGFTNEVGPFSSFPDALDPRIVLLAYQGDLGMDDGLSQNIFVLDKDNLEQYKRPGALPDDPRGDDLRLTLAVGESAELPDGGGTVEFTGWQRWVKLQISNNPGEPVALAGVVLAFLGLMASLFIRPRRLWVRVREEGGTTLVEVAGLDRSTAGEGLDDEVARLTDAIAGPTPAAPPQHPEEQP